VAMIVLSTTLVWVIGSSLRHVDLRRVGAEEALDQLNQATALRRAAEVSVARLAAVVEQSSDAILTLDLTAVILDWNRAAEDIHGYLADEVVGQKASSILAPPDAGSHRDGARQPLDFGRSGGREFTVTRADGRIITVAVTSSPILDAAGRLAAISSISRDISDQKAVELALRDSELRMKTSLDNMLDGFAIMRSVRDDDGIVDFEWTYINPIGAATYGRSVPEMIGASMCAVTPHQVVRCVRGVLRSGQDGPSPGATADGVPERDRPGPFRSRGMEARRRLRGHLAGCD
jgi:PAS domain S-box-containing protein